jgi:MOSC domain-containing protein YiiM
MEPVDTAAPRNAPRDFTPHLGHVRAAPADRGRVESIVLRPRVDERVVVQAAMVDSSDGVVGDSWRARGSSSREDGSANPDSQVTVMSVRALAAIEPDPSRWPLAGDQLLVDADLSVSNLPAGSRFAVGDVILEVSETPHTGCSKFSARFGSDALRWVNSPEGRELRLRGVNTRVVQGGAVQVGDVIRKV